jgi:hypothetical protein
MRHSAFSPVFSSVLVALSLAVSQAPPARATEVRSFVLTPAEGYGVQECLATEGECGPAMADAWCQSQGRARAISYGPSHDADGVAPADGSREVEPSAYVITCSD